MAPRDHRAVYQRRQELARERGFTSYGQQRREFKYASESYGGEGQVSYVDVFGEPRAGRPGDAERVRMFYQAFAENPNDYSVDGAKARWFVEVEGIMTYDEWRAHYPRGIRDYSIVGEVA